MKRFYVKANVTASYVYQTDFHLVVPVNDYWEARRYLIEDDMTKYLKDYLEQHDFSMSLVNSIMKIEWILQGDDRGIIQLVTSTPLSEEHLAVISSWVSGQNSDGLGEGFEQQDFAWQPYEDDDGWDTGDGEMASFDWMTNKYIFHEVQ